MGAHQCFGRRDGPDDDGKEFYELVAANGRRSLELLRAIEDTIDVMAHVAEDTRRFATRHEEVAKLVWERRPGTATLDPDDILDALFGSIQDRAKVLHRHYRQCQQSAASDKDLQPDDGVVEAFGEACAAMVELFNACEDLRTAIREYDADSSSVGQPVEDVEELLATLKS
jgi:hypothetical protein